MLSIFFFFFLRERERKVETETDRKRKITKTETDRERQITKTKRERDRNKGITFIYVKGRLEKILHTEQASREKIKKNNQKRFILYIKYI